MPEFVVEFGAGEEPPADDRLHGPAFARNHAPIWSVIAPYLGDRPGDILEIGSGTGEHVVTYAARSPTITWWPSDIHNRAVSTRSCSPVSRSKRTSPVALRYRTAASATAALMWKAAVPAGQ